MPRADSVISFSDRDEIIARHDLYKCPFVGLGEYIGLDQYYGQGQGFDPAAATRTGSGNIFAFSIQQWAAGSQATTEDIWGPADMIYLPTPWEWSQIIWRPDARRMDRNFLELKAVCVDAFMLAEDEGLKGLRVFLQSFPQIRRVVVADTWARAGRRADSNGYPKSVRIMIREVASACRRGRPTQLAFERTDGWDGAQRTGLVHTVVPDRSSTIRMVMATAANSSPGADHGVTWETFVHNMETRGSYLAGGVPFPWDDYNGEVILCSVWRPPHGSGPESSSSSSGQWPSGAEGGSSGYMPSSGDGIDEEAGDEEEGGGEGSSSSQRGRAASGQADWSRPSWAASGGSGSGGSGGSWERQPPLGRRS